MRVLFPGAQLRAGEQIDHSSTRVTRNPRSWTYLRTLQHVMRVYDRAGRLIRELSISPMTVVTDLRSGVRDNELVVEARTGFAPTRPLFRYLVAFIALQLGLTGPETVANRE